ncbi:kinase-like protein [Fomes fomentarius]|nr:kinase-like protein [Fomes fomentarius]
MSATSNQKRLPRHATLNSQASVESAAQATNAGYYNLLPGEKPWRDRQPFLQKLGYSLRPRYSPDWKPSWIGTTLQPAYCEDSVMLQFDQVIDATRVEDGERVAIKVTQNDKRELQITQFLSSIRESQNHCIPIFQVLPDPLNSNLSLMVMPYLRPCNDPEFWTIGEVIDFIDQTVEGLAFLHKQNVAHRDIAVANIMMDGRALYPGGHHPVRRNYTPDAMFKATPLTRTERPVRYFYIDFGLSMMFSDGDPRYAVGDVGRDDKVPELSSHTPYDPFKVDIYALGNLYFKEFEEKYSGVEFLLSMIERMKEEHPEKRPPMDEISTQWKDIKAKLEAWVYRSRLAPRSEPMIERVFNNTVAAAWNVFKGGYATS